MAVIDRDYITSRSIYDKMFCTTLFWCSLKRPSVKLTKLLVRCLNAPWKSFYVNLAFERLAFVTFWKLIHSHAVTPRWLDDGKECIQSAWSKQRDCCSVFLENYLAVSTLKWKLEFTDNFGSRFIGHGPTNHSESWIQLWITTVHYHFGR